MNGTAVVVSIPQVSPTAGRISPAPAYQITQKPAKKKSKSKGKR